MKIKFLGTGTSQGVPVIGCSCRVCRSGDSRDKRYRSSALITTEHGKKILIDCGPDFRMQMLDNNEETVDAILLTHEHNDHVIGLDDVRPLIFKTGKEMPIYAQKRVCEEVKLRFPYAFAEERYPGAPSFDLHEIYGSFYLYETDINPINVLHLELPILGYKFKNLAYITDASLIPEAEKEKLKNLDILILNCIRKETAHPAHFILKDVVALNEELHPKTIYLTHVSHHFGLWAEEEALLPQNIHLAYDGLEFKF